MPASQANRIVRHLRKMALLRDGGELPDGQLLESFLVHREEVAFEALVRRHGPMVLAVCRRVLRNSHDAEDAFQATFLVLIRRAASIGKRELLSNWLYGVAYRTALKAKTTAAKRRLKEARAEAPLGKAVPGENWQELLPLLDQELQRLPDKYRTPIVLCDLEGKTRKAAARLLGIPEGTLSTRLNRGRALLAKKLLRHGTALSVASLGILLAQPPVSATVPPALLAATVGTAALGATGNATGTAISAKVLALTEGVLQSMQLTKMKISLIVLLTMLLLGGGVGLPSYHLLGAGEPSHQEKAENAKGVKEIDASQDEEDLAWDRLGLRLQPVGRSEVAQASQQLRGGMKVLAVRPNSPAAEQGIRKGDVLVGLHHWETTTLESIPFVLGFRQGAGMERLPFFVVRQKAILQGEFNMEPAAPPKVPELMLEKLGSGEVRGGREQEQEKAVPVYLSAEGLLFWYKAAPGKIDWRTDYVQAREEALKKKLPLCIYFRSEKSQLCSQLESGALSDAKVVTSLNQSFIPVKLDFDKFAAILNITSAPTILVASCEGKVTMTLSIVDPIEAAALLKTLMGQKNLLGKKSAPADSDIGIMVTAHRKMTIPIQVDRAATDLKELRLFVSTDEGKTWDMAATIAPGEKAFPFHAPKDGLYWLVVQTVHQNGRTVPSIVAGSTSPQVKILVDTEHPK